MIKGRQERKTSGRIIGKKERGRKERKIDGRPARSNN